MNLDLLTKNLQLLKQETETNPLKFARFTPAQEEFLRCTNKFYLLRGGNQIGKSFVGAAEVIYRALGKHPYKPVSTPPVQIWVICHSWSQSVEIQKRIWDLLPKDEITDDVSFSPAKGFRGAGTPVITMKNGSLIRIKTTQQTGGSSKGTIALASGTIDFCLVDEPCNPLVWSELVGRVLRKRGQIAMTMTPVGVDCSHIKKLCDDGIMVDIQAPLNLQNVTPRDCKPLLSKDELEEIERSYMAFDRDIRMTGSWEGYTPHGVIFADFKAEHISKAPPPNGHYQYCVGIDHGSQDGAQFAVLIAVRIPDPHVKSSDNDYYLYVLDEYTSGAAKATIHAKGILAMLQRNRLKPNDIYRWIGDRPHRGAKYGSRMSNKMLRAAFAHILQYPQGKGFTIHTAYKPSFSVYYGVRVLNELIQKDNFQIHPRCQALTKSLKSWAITKTGKLADNQYKHGIDALRYAALPCLDSQYRAPRKTHIKIIR